ncbi:hypothetical protein [Cellvibrio sp. OA-2007]|uniref:hypothetical protein n=1 Tax=Cellvibrio sp. OA-2007 TaxID=529823 RepID=UPI000A7BD658|nr:hypothetical protein [Cellvibrio sp. OA-2007]
MKIFIIFFLLSLAACSQRQIYDSVQTSNRNECEILSGVQRKECLARLAPDYQTYEQQRQELLKDR